VEIDFSLIQIDIGQDEILLGPQENGPVTKTVLTNEEKSQLEALITHPNILTISQRKLSLQPYREVLVDCLLSEVVDGVRTNPPDPNYVPGTGINLPVYPGQSDFSVILPRGTQVALQCDTSDDEEAILHIDSTQAGLRKDPEKNPTVDMLFAATQHRATVKAPIGQTVVIGSFENYRSGTDIAIEKKTPDKKTLLLIRPTKVVRLPNPLPEEADATPSP